MTEMASHLRDSILFGRLWATEETRTWFSEPVRVREWLRILGWLAQAQSDIGAIPREAADRIADVCEAADPPLEEIAVLTRTSGHSTYGLLEWLQARVGAEASGYVAVATTVQDITDLWTARTLQRVGARLREELRGTITVLREQARRHRSVPMLARTHGQPGVPMTLGWKLASWGIELERHRRRFEEGRPRWEVAAVGGSVGTLAYWGRQAPLFVEALAERSGLAAPIGPWGAARDSVAEFACDCALLTATLAKIGTEVCQLQRPEIGEVLEAAGVGEGRQVGSVTMPHKRNPERSEHLATLNTLTHAAAGAMMAAATGEHERDGRTWKVEWVALPDVCCFASVALAMAGELLVDVEWVTDRMLQNIEARADQVLSEQRMRLPSAERRYREAYRDERAWLQTSTSRDSGAERREPHNAERASLEDAIQSAEALVDRWLAGDGR